MYDEPFAGGDSLIHHLDPRLRLVLAALASICLALFSRPEAAACGLLFAVLVAALSAPPLALLLKRLALVNVFIVFIWLTVPPSMPGETLASLGPLDFSREGLELSLLVTLKANAIILLLISLVASMNAASLGQALERLRCPGKLVFLLLFTYRYMHVVAAQWAKLQTAARLRSFRMTSSMHSYRSIGNMFGMTFVQSFDRAARVYEAMLLRGFDGSFHGLAVFRLSAGDIAFGLIFLLLLAGLTFFDLYPR